VTPLAPVKNAASSRWTMSRALGVPRYRLCTARPRVWLEMVSSPAVLERDSREARKKGDLVRRGRGGYAIGVRGRGRG
jgi:hypothetical protein